MLKHVDKIYIDSLFSSCRDACRNLVSAHPEGIMLPISFGCIQGNNIVGMLQETDGMCEVSVWHHDRRLLNSIKIFLMKEMIQVRLIISGEGEEIDGSVKKLPSLRLDILFMESFLKYAPWHRSTSSDSDKERGAMEIIVFAVVGNPYKQAPEPGNKKHASQVLSMTANMNASLRDNIFHAMRPMDWTKETPDPPGMKCSLFKYQRRALSWMIWRENAGVQEGDPGSIKTNSYISIDDIPLQLESKTMYFNLNMGCFREEPALQRQPQGGILADEMGLGKTVEIMSLVLATRDMESRHRILKREDDLLPGGTLVICPPTLLHQWRSEIENHTAGSIKVEIYAGIRSILDGDCSSEDQKRQKVDIRIEQTVNRMMSGLSRKKYGAITQDMVREAHMYAKRAAGEPLPIEDPTTAVLKQARSLAVADIVLTSFDVLQREIYYDSSKNNRSLRHPKRYLIPDCALLKVNFFRMVTDEAQMIGSMGQVAQMTEKIKCSKRWCVTGTPMVSSNELGDLRSLLSFLQMMSPSFDRAWTNLIVQPLKPRKRVQSAISTHQGWLNLVRVLLPIMWRTDKMTVRSEFNLPPRQLHSVPLRLQAGEAELYHQLVEKARQADKAYKVGSAALEDIKNELSPFVSTGVKNAHIRKVHKLEEDKAASLLQLRLACIHPQLTKFWREEMAGDLQIGSGGMTSMEEVLQRLVDKEQGELQEAERMVCYHLNTIAMRKLDKVEALNGRRNGKTPEKSPSTGGGISSPSGNKSINPGCLVNEAMEELIKSHKVSEKGIKAIDLTLEEMKDLPDPEALASSSWAAWRRIQINTAEQILRALNLKNASNEICSPYKDQKEKRMEDYFQAAGNELQAAVKSKDKLQSKFDSLVAQAEEVGMKSYGIGFPSAWGVVKDISNWIRNFLSELDQAKAKEKHELEQQASSTEHVLGRVVAGNLSEKDKNIRTDLTPLESWVSVQKLKEAEPLLLEAIRLVEDSTESKEDIPFKDIRYNIGKWTNLLTPFKRDTILNQFSRILPVPRQTKFEDGEHQPVISIVLAEEAIGFSRPRDVEDPRIVNLAARLQGFIPCNAWSGRLKGYSFYRGEDGLGYHLDALVQPTQEAPLNYNIVQCGYKMIQEFRDRIKKLSKNVPENVESLFENAGFEAVALRLEMTSKLIDLIRTARDLHNAEGNVFLKQKQLVSLRSHHIMLQACR